MSRIELVAGDRRVEVQGEEATDTLATIAERMWTTVTTAPVRPGIHGGTGFSTENTYQAVPETPGHRSSG